MGQGVEYLKFYCHQACNQRLITIAYDTVALHDIVSIREPVPGACKAGRVGMMISIKNSDKFTAYLCQCCINILGLSGTTFDPQELETGIALSHLAQNILDREVAWRIIREDYLQRRRIIHTQKSLDRFDNGGSFIRQIRRNDCAGRRVWRTGTLRSFKEKQCQDTFHPDKDSSNEQGYHIRNIDNRRNISPPCSYKYI